VAAATVTWISRPPVMVPHVPGPNLKVLGHADRLNGRRIPLAIGQASAATNAYGLVRGRAYGVGGSEPSVPASQSSRFGP
jgi:hypothetical protein